jgi:V/A-type H+-transporting ATPase subunit I
LRARLSELDGEIAAVAASARRLGRRLGPRLAQARQVLHDGLLELEASALAGGTRRFFVVDGWAPVSDVPRITARLADAFGAEVVVETLAREQWAGEEAPVVLRNPRIFRPFEIVMRLVPLPRYGTVDPTPFVAVFFPMLFGVVLGDIGYGLVLALVALLLRRGSRTETVRRSLSEIAGACAAFAVIFGVLYGELFGDLGHRWLGLEALALAREEAIVPFLLLAVALGVVHLAIGLGLGVVGAIRTDPKRAAGHGVTLAMLLLVVVALLAALEVLPSALFTPAVVALLVGFPLLVLLEGLTAPIELLSTLGRVLSYARVMALGTASVMLAVMANRLAGALGSAVVGALFALLFHLVNFAIGVFSPVIHVLRLHYVEFFGTFYSPGGVPYRPFTRWGHGSSRA